MITVEKSLKSLEREIDILDGFATDSQIRALAAGAAYALHWIINGGKSPSEFISDEIRSFREAAGPKH